MTKDKTVTMSRELAEKALAELTSGAVSIGTGAALRALLAAPVVERQEPVAETVPKHKFDTLVQHCKRLDSDIAQARAHVNEITLYQQNAVWFWQHDGEDYLQSLSCPIIIQPHHLRELLEGKAQHNPITSPPAPVSVVLPERRELSNKMFDEMRPSERDISFKDIGWNACLDKVKEMNQ